MRRVSVMAVLKEFRVIYNVNACIVLSWDNVQVSKTETMEECIWLTI
jgi:hypothetical protein